MFFAHPINFEDFHITMRKFALICVVILLTKSSVSAAADLTADEVRSAYRHARPRLEAIWEKPAHYTFEHSIKRWDMPPAMAGKVRPEGFSRFEIFGQKGRWRIDTFATVEGGSTNRNSVIFTKNGQYRLTKRAKMNNYDLANSGSDSRPFEETQKNIAGMCEVAFVLPTRVDVSDILFGPNYRITVILPADRMPVAGTQQQTKAVTIDFERSPRSNPSEKVKRLVFETGRVTFLPDRDWAIDHFTLHTNTGLHIEGGVRYQQIDGMDSRTVPERVNFTTTESRSSLKTSDVLALVAIKPGPIDDRLFGLSEFQLKALGAKQSEVWSLGAILIGLGVVLIVVAIVVRVLAKRKSRSPN